MAAPRSFLDNLANLRIVMSVALEHVQATRAQFVKTATNEQVRKAQTVISKIQTLAEELEKEFKALEDLATQHRRVM
jgi:hypothetical protein